MQYLPTPKLRGKAWGDDGLGDWVERNVACYRLVHDAAQRQRDEPLIFITDPELFGDLAGDERFTTPYLDALESLHDKGSRAILPMLVG